MMGEFHLTMQRLETTQDESDEDHEPVVEVDPTGRFERYAKCLGRGAYKEVFLGFDQEESVEVAWNQLRVDFFRKKDAQRLLSEIRILEQLRDENIINLFAAWIAKDPVTGQDRVCFVTELMTSGTLKSYIRKMKGAVKPKVLRNWARQILSGLSYLHSRNPPIIHRDLKCENIFINGNNAQAKIGDLGLAATKYQDHLSSVLGTPEFMAPELYDEKYDEKVDIYGFGMVILEIVTKEYPYRECENQAQIYKKVSSGIKPQALQRVADLETRAFIETCLEFDPSKRPSANELLLHPFLLTVPGASFGPELDPSVDKLFDVEVPPHSQTQQERLPAIAESEPYTTTHQLSSPHILNTSLQSTVQTTQTASSTTTNTSLTISYHSWSSGSRPSVTVDSIPESAKPRSMDSGSQTTETSVGTVISDPKTTTVDAEHHTFEVCERSRPPTIMRSQSAPTNSGSSCTCIVEILEKLDTGAFCVKMTYGSGSKVQDIKFPFDHSEDTPSSVVEEMVAEHLIQMEDASIVLQRLMHSIADASSKSRDMDVQASLSNPEEEQDDNDMQMDEAIFASRDVSFKHTDQADNSMETTGEGVSTTNTHIFLPSSPDTSYRSRTESSSSTLLPEPIMMSLDATFSDSFGDPHFRDLPIPVVISPYHRPIPNEDQLQEMLLDDQAVSSSAERRLPILDYHPNTMMAVSDTLSDLHSNNDGPQHVSTLPAEVDTRLSELQEMNLRNFTSLAHQKANSLTFSHSSATLSRIYSGANLGTQMSSIGQGIPVANSMILGTSPGRQVYGTSPGSTVTSLGTSPHRSPALMPTHPASSSSIANYDLNMPGITSPARPESPLHMPVDPSKQRPVLGLRRTRTVEMIPSSSCGPDGLAVPLEPKILINSFVPPARGPLSAGAVSSNPPSFASWAEVVPSNPSTSNEQGKGSSHPIPPELMEFDTL